MRFAPELARDGELLQPRIPALATHIPATDVPPQGSGPTPAHVSEARSPSRNRAAPCRLLPGSQNRRRKPRRVRSPCGTKCPQYRTPPPFPLSPRPPRYVALPPTPPPI